MTKLTQAFDKFVDAIHQEHLENASCLYEQRLNLITNPEITWLDFDDFEQRFEAHIDGLVVGGEEVLEICQQQAIEGDAGEAHAAVRVFCRQQRRDLLKYLFSRIEPDEAEKWQAITDALKDEMPPAWFNELYPGNTDADHPLAWILPSVVGYQRINAGSELLNSLNRVDNPAIQETIIRALGRLREPYAREPHMNSFIDNGDAGVRTATVLTLMRLGEASTIPRCANEISSRWSHLPLALGGGGNAAAVLLAEITGRSDVDANSTIDSINTSPDGVAWTQANTDHSLLALGLTGTTTVVPYLLSLLANQQRAPSAALALNLITGAGLYEEVFLPEPIDVDELFEDELEKYKKGEPLYPPGEEPGTNLIRLSLNCTAWQTWWDQNKSQFDSRLRYRNGKPFSPSCLLENLESEKSPPVIRQLAYEELVIRYGIDFPFETTMFVSRQKETLAKFREWIAANGSRFQPGIWYFAGRSVAN